MSHFKYISLIILLLGLSQRIVACGESAGADFDICFNELSHNLPTPADTYWTGADVTATGLFNPAAPGVYTVTLVTDRIDCQDTDDLTITVLASPNVNAGADDIVCMDDNFQINALASSPNGGIVVWSWSGDDEYLSSTNIPNPIATPVGSASFNLSVVDAAGCFSFDQINLTIANLPLVDAGVDKTLCHGSTVIELDGLPAGGSWSGPGVSSGEFVSPGVGTHNLEYSYTDSNSCENTDQLSITVDPLPSIDAGSDLEVCLNKGEFDLIGFSPSSGIQWSGNGVIDDQTGTIDSELLTANDHTLTMSFGEETCYVEDHLVLTVKPLPNIQILSEYDVCENELSPELTDNIPSGGHWLGSAVANMSTGEIDMSNPVGDYTVRYAYTDNTTQCADTVTSTLSINEVPEALFSLEPLDCINSDLDITNNSEAGLMSTWFINNTVVSNDFTPSISQAVEATYSVNLQVENEHGCFDEGIALNVEVIDVPVAEFSLSETNGCEPLISDITNESVGSYNTYSWDYVLATSSLENPGTINFGDVSEDTVFPVSVTASNYCGTDVKTINVTAFALPEADFHTDITTFCSPVFVEFGNDSQNNPNQYFWDLGDGETTDDETPEDKIYVTENSSEDFEISLTATNDCGSHTISEIITVLPNPVTSGFTASTIEACAPVQIDFSDISTGGTNIIYDFGDFELNDPDVNHTFLTPGNYEVKQYVTDGCGFDTTVVSVLIYPEPVVDFTLSDNIICQSNVVDFNQTGEALSSQEWTFGTEGMSSLANPSFIFNDLGQQTVVFEAETALNNCAVTITQDIEVMSPPVIGYTLSHESGCSPFAVQIDNSTTNSNQMTWSLNGVSQFNDDTTFELSEPGFYDLEVTAVNQFGCVSIISESNVFELYDVPVTDFSFTPEDLDILYEAEAQFQNEGTGATIFNWDFGDGKTSEEENPTHLYTEAGAYPVTLSSFNDDGCSSSITYGVVVEDRISVFVPNSFTPNGDGVNEVFTPIIAGNDYISYRFLIYDRWGNIIFESYSPNDSWIGNVNGGDHYTMNGSYTWELTLELGPGEGIIQKTGVVSVFR